MSWFNVQKPHSVDFIDQKIQVILGILKWTAEFLKFLEKLVKLSANCHLYFVDFLIVMEKSEFCGRVSNQYELDGSLVDCQQCCFYCF